MSTLAYIKSRTGFPSTAISNTLKLFDEGATIPFIARYRKELTQNLDEVQVGEVLTLKHQVEELEKRKETILRAIESQDSLDKDLEEKIRNAYSLQRLEDLYLPYKKKRKTRADTAREQGLEPLAKILMAQNATDIENVAARFSGPKSLSVKEALDGAGDIIAEWMNEHEHLRANLRKFFQRTADIATRVVKAKKEEEASQKFRNYFDWQESLRRIPSHRLLAILRAEREGVVRIKVEVDKEKALEILERYFLKNPSSSSAPLIKGAAADAYKRLLFPFLSKESIGLAREKAEEEAIIVFADNLRQLLLAPPLGAKRILAIDPGFRSGCKLVCLDEKGDLQHNETIFPHPPQKEAVRGMKKLRSLVNAYNIEAIAIGNGTASRETEMLVKKTGFDREVQVFVVSEAGASVYSASKLARSEFPDHDVTVRGAVSIGRRLIDPLAELVKIDPKAIGVGQYQHDVDQVKLKKELDRVVERCVNGIGVNVNTASAPLLSYVSGIGPGLAGKIVNYRSELGRLTCRKELLKVSGLGNKAFEQAAGFLRIPGGEHPLDNSSVHPESYEVVGQMAADLGISLTELVGNKDLIRSIDPQRYVSENTGLPTLNDILVELEKPGVDPRRAAKVFEFDANVRTIEDLDPGMNLPGIVNNITNFGCFVDIGIKESGLVHISKLAKSFVNDVNAVVKLHQQVRVTVLEVDRERKRIQLSMID